MFRRHLTTCLPYCLFQRQEGLEGIWMGEYLPEQYTVTAFQLEFPFRMHQDLLDPKFFRRLSQQ